ncbi:ComF family protein [Shewanella acanthi]|uniref:ComF family protein n=1 Tax=Shewanella acanthi TaxID=2864212 RepID=UPI001C655AE6|nr:double zinc ribbon domain-containing protein [Shewanella acanthi]QYJ78709.1 double zinc ribbon domain-containing protein [Shewanella acanthi]
MELAKRLKLRHFAQYIWTHYLAGSLPNRCLLCHQSLSADKSGICSVCLQACLYRTPICLGCGKSMLIQIDYCGECQKQAPIKVIAPCSYHQGLGPWIAAIKYQRQLAALPVLCEALAERIRQLEQQGLVTFPQAILPVPLHPKRLRQRGFNQAWLIAKELSHSLNLPLVDNSLRRIQDTKPQAGLTGAQRRRNLYDAFELESEFTYQRIALIDDVVTTGTTIAEISRLFEARFVQVQVWCLARAEAPGLLDDLDVI